MMYKKCGTNPELIWNVLIPYICLLYFLFVQASVSLRMILELLDLVPGAFYGLTGTFMVFGGTACLMVKVLLRIGQLMDETAVFPVHKAGKTVGVVICFGLIYPAAMGFSNGMAAWFYYKAMNLCILLPWAVAGIAVAVQDRTGHF